MSKALSRSTFALRLTAAGQFIADLQKERRIGNVCLETEQRPKDAFRTLGWEAPDPTLAAAIDSESTGCRAKLRPCGSCEPSCSRAMAGVDGEYRQTPVASMAALITRTTNQTF